MTGQTPWVLPRRPSGSGRVPRSVPIALCGLLALQILLATCAPNHWRLESSPGAPPNVDVVRLASLDEAQLAAYATSLYVQEFDAQAGALLPLRSADFAAIRAWLELALALNPRSGYPVMLAALDYAEAAHRQDEVVHRRPPQAQAMLDLVERGFRANPGANWRWLAQASWVARYVMHDERRSLALAQPLRNGPVGAAIAPWARPQDSYLPRAAGGAEPRLALLEDLAARGANAGPGEAARLDRPVPSIARTPGQGAGWAKAPLPASSQSIPGQGQDQ